ncbi:MAG: rmlB [Planctomycetota bacterium]|nr:rmlB [Planctomycetota bacterium]
MKTLIVGCGYLGMHVGRALRQDDPAAEVFGTTRTSQSSSRFAGSCIHPIVADVLDPASFVDLPRVDQIVHCVGYDRAAGVPMRRVYVDGLRHLLAHLDSCSWSGRFVLASSTGVYGQTGGEWVDETSPTRPGHASGIVCLEAEEVLRQWSAVSGNSATTIRFAGLYGPGRIVRRDAIVRGEPIIGDPNRWLNLIQIEDAARAVQTVLRSGTPIPVIVAGDDRPTRRQEYYELVARCLDAPIPHFLPPPEGSPEAARDESDKRVSNSFLRNHAGLALRYPDIATGVPASLA